MQATVARSAILPHAALRAGPGRQPRAVPAGTRPRRALALRSRSFPEDLINSISVAVKQSPLNGFKKALAVAQAGQYDESAVKAKVESAIADNPVVVFSWSGCPFCKQAKSVLDGTGAKYTALELDQMADGDAIRAELAKLTDRTSVPNIFIAGKSVGGCNDGPGVATLQKKGELVPMLQAAGAL